MTWYEDLVTMFLQVSIVLSTILAKSIKSLYQWGINLWYRLVWMCEYLWLESGKHTRYDRTRLPSFSKRTPLHDMALVFEEGTLWYPRQVLSLHSPYFHSRLNPTSPKRSSAPLPNVDRVTVEGVSYQDALCLLRCLTPGDTFMHVDMANVLALGRAANKLEIGEVMKRCKRFLVEQSSSLCRDGDARLVELLVIVGQLGYRPLLDYLIIRASDAMTFEDIRKRYRELPPVVTVALYDLKLSVKNRQSHSWQSSPIKPEEFCDCGDEPCTLGQRCRKCKKICCDLCYRDDGIGARGKCTICSECDGKLEIRKSSGYGSEESVFEDLCMCSPKLSPGLLS